MGRSYPPLALGVLDVLAEANRRRILDLLRHDDRPVGELVGVGPPE